MNNFQLARSEILAYLEELTGSQVDILEIRELSGEATGATALKQFGYGRPLQITYVAKGQEESIVIHRITRNAFGRERDDDRAAAVWLDFDTFNRLPGHVPALDKVIHKQQGGLQSICLADDILLVTAYKPGHCYAQDLMRIRDQRKLQPVDIQRAEALAAYLAKIHKLKHEDAWLWRRRLRDLVGHGEGIMGIADSYPLDQRFISQAELRQIEDLANRWRWQLKPMSHRLSQVHGDFHPFNILFGEGLDFHLLDRSRGAWGDPADDVSCMTTNYLFFSLQCSGKLEGPFAELHNRFWENYLEVNPDNELWRVIQPWFAWRALVIASPVWYPTIAEEVRWKLLTFARRILQSDEYDFTQVNRYLEEV